MSAVKRHPIRGFFGGLFLGLGVALLLVVSSQIALGTLTPLVVVAVGIVVGVLWAVVGPARGGRRDTTTVPAPVPMPPPVVEPVEMVEPTGSAESAEATAQVTGPAEPVEPVGQVGSGGEEPASEAADAETLMGWAPTHTAPEDGLVTYAGSEEGGGENGRLEPGLPVQVVERNDQWARIICSNGWAAWVDADRLVEHPGAGADEG